MSLRTRQRARRHVLVPLLVGSGSLGTASWVRAEAEEPPRPPRPIVLRSATQGFALVEHQPPRGLELRFARELDWSRLVLSESGSGLWLLGNDRSLLRPPMALPPGIEPPNEFSRSGPNAIGSVASAAGSVLTKGFSVFEVRRDGKLRMRHSISAYFRKSGVNLGWRIEF